MAYIALYRKYRSQSFGELMGQDAVTTVLQNSLRSGRIAHAYLFYGARGCGKTSTARLLSRALNCESQDGPTPEPCGVCRICTAIRDGACMDVVEIDAASETGVDNVREKIVENVQYVPTEARYKVYIIDEVHDLSAKAFDALLKTLEEPPPHVVFILATTEQHKVPITIRSRCIPFQFKRGTLVDLAAAIQRVIDAEGYSAEPAAVRAMARCAEGSWRDALSLLEQVISYSDAAITEETVQQALGTVGSETLNQVVQTLSRNSWSDTLTVAGSLIDSGKDVRQLLTSLSGYLRDLLLITSGAQNTAVTELGADRMEQLGPIANLFSSAQLLTMLGILAAAEKETRLNNQHRWLLERALCHLMPINLTQERNAAVSPAPIQVAASYHTQSVAPYQSSRPASTGTHSNSEQKPDRVEQPTQTHQSSESPAASRFAGDITLQVVSRAWPRIVAAIVKVSPSASGFLPKAEVAGLDQKTIILKISDQFAQDRILGKGKALVEKKINEVLQTEGYRIRAGLYGNGKPESDGGRVIGSIASTNAAADGSNTTKPAERSLVEEALEIFGGEVIRTETQ